VDLERQHGLADYSSRSRRPTQRPRLAVALITSARTPRERRLRPRDVWRADQAPASVRSPLRDNSSGRQKAERPARAGRHGRYPGRSEVRDGSREGHAAARLQRLCDRQSVTKIKALFTGLGWARRSGVRHLEGFPTAPTRRFRPWHGGCETRPNCMRAQRGLYAPVAHALLGGLDATGTSTEHTTCPVRRSSSGPPLRHVGWLADAPQVPRDALRIGDEREQVHPSAAAWARQHVEPKGPFEKLRPRTIAASARALGHVRRGFEINRRLRRETGLEEVREDDYSNERVRILAQTTDTLTEVATEVAFGAFSIHHEH